MRLTVVATSLILFAAAPAFAQSSRHLSQCAKDLLGEALSHGVDSEDKGLYRIAEQQYHLLTLGMAEIQKTALASAVDLSAAQTDEAKKLQVARFIKRLAPAIERLNSANMGLLETLKQLIERRGSKATIVQLGGRMGLRLEPGTPQSRDKLARVLRGIARPQYGYTGYFDPLGLILSGSLGMTAQNYIVFSFESVVTGKVDGTDIHELRHMYENHLKKIALEKGSGDALAAGVVIPTHEQAGRMVSYHDRFRIDEIFAQIDSLFEQLRANYYPLRMIVRMQSGVASSVSDEIDQHILRWLELAAEIDFLENPSFFDTAKDFFSSSKKAERLAQIADLKSEQAALQRAIGGLHFEYLTEFEKHEQFVQTLKEGSKGIFDKIKFETAKRTPLTDPHTVVDQLADILGEMADSAKPFDDNLWQPNNWKIFDVLRPEGTTAAILSLDTGPNSRVDIVRNFEGQRQYLDVYVRPNAEVEGMLVFKITDILAVQKFFEVEASRQPLQGSHYQGPIQVTGFEKLPAGFTRAIERVREALKIYSTSAETVWESLKKVRAAWQSDDIELYIKELRELRANTLPLYHLRATSTATPKPTPAPMPIIPEPPPPKPTGWFRWE